MSKKNGMKTVCRLIKSGIVPANKQSLALMLDLFSNNGKEIVYKREGAKQVIITTPEGETRYFMEGGLTHNRLNRTWYLMSIDKNGATWTSLRQNAKVFSKQTANKYAAQLGGGTYK
jgi:predicted membrane-bound mannosyltransferase